MSTSGYRYPSELDTSGNTTYLIDPPAHKPKRDVVLYRDTMDNTTYWINTQGTLSKASGENEFFSSIDSTQGSMKSTSNGSGFTSYNMQNTDISAPWYDQNVNGKIMKIRYYRPYNTDGSILTGITLDLYLGNDTTFNNVIKYPILASDDIKSGWGTIYVEISRDDGTSQGTTIGTGWDPSVANLKAIRFKAGDPLQNENYYFIIDSVEIITPDSSYVPEVCVTFDDNLVDQREMIAYAIGKGVPVTLYVNGGTASGSGSSYLYTEELQSLQKTGMVLIANHAYDHESPVADGLDLNAAIGNVTRNITWMKDNGFAYGSRFFSYPNGGSAWRTTAFEAQDELLGIYLKQVRTSPSTLNGSSFRSKDDPLFLVPSIGDNMGTAITEGYGLYLEAKTRDLPFLCLIHDQTRTIMSEYKTLIDLIATDNDAGTVNAVTVDALL